MAKDDKKAVPAIGNKEILAEVNLISQVQQIETKLAYQPNSIRFAQLADAYLGIGQYDEAIKTLEEGLQNYPGYGTANLVLAKAHYLRGDKKRAQILLNEHLQKHPANLAAHKLLGDLALEEDDIINAVSKYRVALRYDPVNRHLIQTLVDLKDQYQKIKATRSDEEDEDVKPVFTKPAPKPRVEAAPTIKKVEEPKPHLIEAEPGEEGPTREIDTKFIVLPKEKEELKMPTDMVEDLIVQEMSVPKAKSEEIKKPEPKPKVETPREKPVEKPVEKPIEMAEPVEEVPQIQAPATDAAIAASAAFVDEAGVLYFYDDDEVSFDEYKARLELKKAGRAQILDRAVLDKKITQSGGKPKVAATPESTAKKEPPKEIPKKEIPKKPEFQIDDVVSKPPKKPVVKKPEPKPEEDTPDFRHGVHKDDAIHRHVDSAFGSGEDTGVFITPDQEKTFFDKDETGGEEVLSAEEQEAALDEVEMSYRDYLDVLVDEEDLEEALFKDEEPSDAVHEELHPITERLTKVTERQEEADSDEDSPISYQDYLEQTTDEDALAEATLGEEALMSLAEFSVWLDTSDERIDYATFALLDPDAVSGNGAVSKKSSKTKTVSRDEGAPISYAQFMASDDGEPISYRDYLSNVDSALKAEAVLEEVAEAKIEKPAPAAEPVVKAEPVVEPKKAEIKPEPVVAKQPEAPVVTKEAPKSVVQPVAKAEPVVETEEVEMTDEEINPQDATMELVEKFALQGQYGTAYKVCKMLKMKNPTDAKVDRKVLELKRLYLWSSQLVG